MDDVPWPDLILVHTKKLRPGTLQGAYLRQVTRLNDFSQVFSAPQLAHQILSCPLASCRPEVVGWPDGRRQVWKNLWGKVFQLVPNKNQPTGIIISNRDGNHSIWKITIEIYVVTVIMELNLKEAMASMANSSATGGQGPRTTWLMQLR